MPRVCRRDMVPADEPIRLLCFSSCVRQLSLCSFSTTEDGRKVDRCQAVIELFRWYAQWFAVELYAIVVFSKGVLTYEHWRPDWARSWSAEEVLRRACHALANQVQERCKERNVQWRKGDPPPVELLEDTEAIEAWRAALHDVSRYMQVVKQRAAMQFNKEDKIWGYFWASRFLSYPVADIGRSTAVGMLLDLHAVGSGETVSIEEPSPCSAWHRLAEILSAGGRRIDLKDRPLAVWMNEGFSQATGLPAGRWSNDDLGEEAAGQSKLAGEDPARASGGRAEELFGTQDESERGSADAEPADAAEANRASPETELAASGDADHGAGAAFCEPQRGSVEERGASEESCTLNAGEHAPGTSPVDASGSGARKLNRRRGSGGGQDPARLRPLGMARLDIRREELFELGPVDCRQYGATGLGWQVARGIGPVTVWEWIELVRWLGPTWCAWRLANGKAKEKVAPAGWGKEAWEQWKEDLLKTRELDSAEQCEALEELKRWMGAWGEVSRLESLSSAGGIEQSAERLFSCRGHIEQLGLEVGRILGWSEEKVEYLRQVLGRVELSERKLIGLGEALLRDPKRTLREYLELNKWVERNRAARLARSQAAADGGGGGDKVGASGSGGGENSPDTS